MYPKFLHLEDNKYKMEPISYLECNSRPCTSDEKILQGLHSFYADLYSVHTSKCEIEILHFLDQLAVPEIPEDQIDGLLSQSIIEQEVLDAIGKIRIGKAPGLDSLIPEFYKRYAPIIAKPLAACFNAAIERSLLPISMRRAIITLIFKKGTHYLASNYHLISITNVDYKILAYVLVGKLQAYSDLLIHQSQTAYLPGHFMGTNICKVQDIITDIHMPSLIKLFSFWTLKKLLVVLITPFYFYS